MLIFPLALPATSITRLFSAKADFKNNRAKMIPVRIFLKK
jgi:hypothetical protein